MSEHQAEWQATYDSSGYRVGTLAEMSKIDEGSFRKYLRCDRVPRGVNQQKMVKVMKLAKELPRIQFHPSYGYATQEQIETLKSMKIGADMDALLKQIAEQTRNRGKCK